MEMPPPRRPRFLCEARTSCLNSSSLVFDGPCGPATVSIHVGDCLESLRAMPDQSVHTCITSPPYLGLRSYLPADHPDKHLEIGLEPTPDQFIQALVSVFREVRRVLHDRGTLWLNLGDSFAGSRSVQTLAQPCRAAATTRTQPRMRSAFSLRASAVTTHWCLAATMQLLVFQQKI